VHVAARKREYEPEQRDAPFCPQARVRREKVSKKISMATKSNRSTKKVQEIVVSGAKAQRCVLVGTYKRKPNQLKWIGRRHLYNYPLSAEEMEADNSAWNNVKEIWLYSELGGKCVFAPEWRRCA